MTVSDLLLFLKQILANSSICCSLRHSPSQSHTGSAAGRVHRLEGSQALRWARCHAGRGGVNSREEVR